VFAPLMGWLVHAFGWQWVFAVMGVLGFAFVLVWNRTMYDPSAHPRINRASSTTSPKAARSSTSTARPAHATAARRCTT
jgi:MFS family permease